MKFKRISVTWKKKSNLYSLTLCVIVLAKTYFIIRLLWMLNIDVHALL